MLRTMLTGRRARCSLVSVAAILFLALPALCEAAANPQNDSSKDKPLTQNNSPSKSGESRQDSKDKTQKNQNDRMFFVMPNYYTIEDESQAGSISWKEKFSIAAKGSFDPYEFVTAGFLAGIRQAENAYPAFGQGMEGYGKRYGAALADQADGNIMVGAVFPTIMKTDPRYYRLGKGRPVVRIAYAFTRIFVTRTDSGHSVFNFPEFLGNATAITISNTYYPGANRSFSASAHNWGVQMGIDAFGNELKEFWPDIHHRLARKKTQANASATP